MNRGQIDNIRRQHAAGNWPKFLETIAITGLRGWTGQRVEFRFPVVAIVGENGSGKSTFLKAAACIYEQPGAVRFNPSDFFLQTRWESISGVTITYSVRQGGAQSTYDIKKPTERWRLPERRPRRDAFFLDISRTLPLEGAIGYAKVAKRAVSEVSSDALDDPYRDSLSHILGRAYTDARFATTDADPNRSVGILNRGFGEVSQFHQGAGEDATLDLMQTLQGVPDTSLLLIDEIEASLHPRAQRRLVSLLLDLSRTRRLQIVMSTHSPYVLEELPEEARVLLLPGPSGTNVVYGISAEFAMSRIDEQPHPELHVFVEDLQAAVLLREILAADASGSGLLSRIEIVHVGPSNAVQLMGGLAASGRLPYPSMAFVDGDVGPVPDCATLPGSSSPERTVLLGLQAAGWPNLPARFGLGAGELLTVLDDAVLDPDPHKWTAMIGDRVLKSKNGVWEILATEWARTCLDPAERARVAGDVLGRLP